MPKKKKKGDMGYKRKVKRGIIKGKGKKKGY